MVKHTAEEDGYNNRPGTCAGAKLIGKSGHVARSMTEIYFSFSSNRKGTSFDVFYREPDFAQIKGGKGGAYVEKRVNMKFKKENTVLSCQSCQDTLFVARCDIEEQKCG